MKLIQRLAKGQFRVTTPEVNNGVLDLDFNPIISQFDLKGSFTLIHWQARPKGHREWGIYSSVDDSYRSVAELSINFAQIKSLQLDDATATTVPSAVFYTAEHQITCINQRSIIGVPLLSDLNS